MSARFKPYSEYDESGVAWIGEMPSHWGLQRTKTFFNRMQRPIREQDGIVTAFRDGEVTLRSNRRTDGFTNAAKEIGYQGVRIDDLIVHAMDGFAGAIGVSDSDGKCSPVYSVCTPKQKNKVHVAYYGYLVRQLAVTDFINSLAKGIRERSTEFRYSEFSILRLAVPPLEEQKQIAAFLDYETAKIDALIEKQQQLIALLGEKRQAVISHAVTKGLNPDAPMRDSGVEWLGEVPEHWTLAKVRHLTADHKQGYYTKADYVEIGIPLLRITDIRDDAGIDFDSCPHLTVPKHDASEFGLTIGDFVFVRSGATVGKFGIVNEETDAIFGSYTIRFTFYETVRRDFLKCYFHSGAFFDGLISMLHGGAIKNINAENIKEQTVAVPPTDEQLEIANHVETFDSKFRLLLEKADMQVELLQERRTALISAAVTGKIDVRDWKPRPSDVKTETEVA